MVLNLLLIPRFGLDGALWSTAASYGVGAVGAAILGRRACSPARAVGALAKSGLACGLMAVAVLAVPAFGGLLELILKASAGAVVYGLAVLALDAGGLRGRVTDILQRRLKAA